MANNEVRTSRDLAAQKLDSLLKQMKEAFKRVLGDHWEKAVEVTVDTRERIITLSFDDSLTATRISKAWRELRTVILHFRASYDEQTKVIRLPAHA